MCRKFFIFYFLSVFFLSSCAIHSYFPFICFNKECIRAEFNKGLKSTGGKRGIKKQFKILTTKIKRKNAKKRKSKPDVSNYKISESKLDSLIRDTTKVADYIKMIIHYKEDHPEKRINKDSAYIKSSFLFQSKEDKALINYYLTKYSVKNIMEIFLIITLESSEDIDNKKRLGIMKARRLRNYLIKNRVKDEKIKIK